MNVLVIAPHRDDELIGVGGTILKYKARGDRVAICVVTSSEGCNLSDKAKAYTDLVHQEMIEAHRFCKVDKYYGLPFQPVILETYSRSKLNQAIMDVILEEKPNVVYIPFWGDMQKDHSIVVDASMVVLRAKYNHPVKTIYAYETLSETGINIPSIEKTFSPNVFEDITDFLDKKIEALQYYKSQFSIFPALRSIEAIEALAKYRGATVNVGAAEAFMLVREIR